MFIFLTITLATILITNFLKCHIKGGGGPGGGEVQDQAGLRRPQRCLWWAHVIGRRESFHKNKLLYDSYFYSSQNVKADFFFISSFRLHPLADSILYYVSRPVCKHLTIPISCNSSWNTSCFYQLNINYISYINIINIPDICHGRHGRRPCKFCLAGVNFYRFSAKNWHFRQILREKVAFFTDLTRKIGVFRCKFYSPKILPV